MMLAFYVADKGTYTDLFVAKVTNSKYSHVEFVLSDGTCFSASPRDAGVRFKQINLNSSKWDLYKINIELDEEALIKYFNSICGQPYDYLGAIGSGIGIPLYSKNKKFCSLILSKIFQLKNINQNPESLRKELLRLGYIL